MATGIDHVVIAVNDLDQAIADFGAAGFTVVPGGTHASGETHNALIAFADGSYFELIAWLDPASASRTTWLDHLEQGEGLVDFALRSADLQAEVDRLRAEGLDTPDPAPGGRTRPDGQRVEWLNLRFDEGNHPWLPFYCDSTNDRGLRVPSGTDAIHANGATGISSITVGVSDLAAAARDYAIVSGIEYGSTGEASEKPEFAIGTTHVILEDAGTGTRVNVPVALELVTTGDAIGPLDQALTHGAAITLVAS